MSKKKKKGIVKRRIKKTATDRTCLDNDVHHTYPAPEKSTNQKKKMKKKKRRRK